MVKLRKRGETVRQFILDNVEKSPKDVINATAKKFNISRQAVYKHIKILINQKVLDRDDNGHYKLHPTEQWSETFTINKNTQEDVIWRNEISVRLGQIPDNAINIWHYGFTEMFNNVIDHSESEKATIIIDKTAYSTEIYIRDLGIGIFNKIMRAMNLLDERHAVLELTKGKLTTDPEHHTGEGIFFTSRMFDTFHIFSGNVILSHEYGVDEDWILEIKQPHVGTTIAMELKNNTSRTTKEIFDKFTSEEDYGFNKTIVPVRLAQYGNESLISRSQAKRLLDRIDRFQIVIFDFTGVETIGQAFADEIFRVFATQHPSMEIVSIRANQEVLQVIQRAKNYVPPQNQ